MGSCAVEAEPDPHVGPRSEPLPNDCAKTRVKHAEVITARVVQDDRGWLRLATAAFDALAPTCRSRIAVMRDRVPPLDKLREGHAYFNVSPGAACVS